MTEHESCAARGATERSARSDMLVLALVVAGLAGCGDDDGAPGTDAATTLDAAARDAGTSDAARPDAAGTDAGSRADSGVAIDAGAADASAGIDAATPADGGRRLDAGPGVDAGPFDAGPIASWATCTVPSECTLAPRACCAPCGTPELVNVDGVAITGVDAHAMAVCPVPPVGGCPRCLTRVNPWLFSTCGGGACQALDLRMLSLTECTLDTDCKLRVRDCCECGADTSASNLVAIRGDAEPAFTSLVCDPATACLACIPDYGASGASAHCVAGRCGVTVP